MALAVVVLTGCMPPYYRAGCNGFKLTLDMAAVWVLLCGASLSSVRARGTGTGATACQRVHAARGLCVGPDAAACT